MPESCEHARRRLCAGRERQRCGKLRKRALGLGEVACGTKALEWVLRNRSEHSHGPAAIGDLDALAPLDPAEQLARSLPQLSDSDAGHVLFVAHTRGVGIPASALVPSDKAYVHPAEFYEEDDIELLTGATVTEIDPGGSRVTLDASGLTRGRADRITTA